MLTWTTDQCVVFRKTKEVFGGLSNMAAGYHINLGQYCFRTSEALYQAMRFPDHPDLQLQILAQKSPMAAKLIARKHDHLTRAGWLNMRVDVMEWAVRMKLQFNMQSFGDLLRATESKDIVEFSLRDSFWGAIPNDRNQPTFLTGHNVLGRLLMMLRQQHSLGLPIEPKTCIYDLPNMKFDRTDVLELAETTGSVVAS